MIDGVTNTDSLPVLERLMQFAGARHRIITHNVANLSTPDFRPADLSTDEFRAELGAAIDERRERWGNTGGELHMEDSGQIEYHESHLAVRPEPVHDNILFHDRNDRHVERTMQDLVENFMTFRTAAQFLRSRFDLLHAAIAERV